MFREAGKHCVRKKLDFTHTHKKVEWKKLEKERFFLSFFQSFGLTMGHVGS